MIGQMNFFLIQYNFNILSKKGNYTVRTSKIFEPAKVMNCICELDKCP